MSNHRNQGNVAEPLDTGAIREHDGKGPMEAQP